MKKLTTLIIMDGFGIPKYPERSAINKDNTKYLQTLTKKYPNCVLKASEDAVGLPEGQAGTSDVGHLTIGIGRVKKQPLVQINDAIKDGSFFKNKEINKAMDNCLKNNSSLHLMGIVSDGGVHSNQEHLYALLKLAAEKQLKKVYIHFFADGRDAPPQSANKFLLALEKQIKKFGVGEIATLCGRFYSLDRDKNFDRNRLAYDAMVFGKGNVAKSAKEAIKKAYATGESDEFISPYVIYKNKKPIATINNKDSVILFNYRADRERQLTYIFVEKNDFDWVKHMNLHFVCMTEYDSTFKNVYIAFKEPKMKNILSEIISNNSLKQAKIAETEKYAYVTFAFNNGKQDSFPDEDRFLIDSVKLKSYDQKPEMSARQIAKKACQIVKTNKYDFMVINFANPDMVGHSGVKTATEIAVKVVDDCVKEVVEECLKHNGDVIVTADHGNADEMVYADCSPNKAHTKALVPFILISNRPDNVKLKNKGTLADVAPTVLELLGIKKPLEMTGNSLIVH